MSYNILKQSNFSLPYYGNWVCRCFFFFFLSNPTALSQESVKVFQIPGIVVT